MDTTETYPFSSLEHLVCLVDGWDRWPCLFFFFSDSRIVSHSPFACNWQNKFLDSEFVVTYFQSNKGGNSDIRISCNSMELHLATCMHVVRYVHGLGSNCTSKQIVLSLILLISLVELTDQKRGICRHRILYPLRFGPLFTNDVRILKPMVGLGPDKMKIDLKKAFMENITYFWTMQTKIKTCYIWVNMANSKVWYSSESKQVKKCLRGILSNT